MLYDPDRHEALAPIAWDEDRVRAFIGRLVRDTEARFDPAAGWPTHPRDAADGGADTGGKFAGRQATLYFGAAGVVWALHHLHASGAVVRTIDLSGHLEAMREPNRVAMEQPADADFASYLMGDTGLCLVQYASTPTTALADTLAGLIAGNLDQPCRELMWGSPGTLLAALFMFRRSGEPRFADLYRATARHLHAQDRKSVV